MNKDELDNLLDEQLKNEKCKGKSIQLESWSRDTNVPQDSCWGRRICVYINLRSPDCKSEHEENQRHYQCHSSLIIIYAVISFQFLKEMKNENERYCTNHKIYLLLVAISMLLFTQVNLIFHIDLNHNKKWKR